MSGERFEVGDRVWLMLRPQWAKGERPHHGTVIGVDDHAGGWPGVRIALDQPALTATCYATHSEVHRVDTSEVDR